MASFTVEPSVLVQKAALLTQYADEYEAISNELHSAATSMGSAYDSADNKEYVGKMELCVNDLKQMAAKLRSGANTIKEQAQIYGNQTEYNTQQASRLPG